MVTLLIIATLISSILMIIIVLLQRSKKDGGADPLTSSSTAKIVGINKTTDILEQITWVLATAILCFSIMSTTQLRNRIRKAFDLSSPNTDAAMKIISETENLNKQKTTNTQDVSKQDIPKEEITKEKEDTSETNEAK